MKPATMDPTTKAVAEAIAQTLSAARAAEGIGRPTVADRMDWPPSRQADIAKMEAGTVNMSLATLVLWAKALGYEVTLTKKRGAR